MLESQKAKHHERTRLRAKGVDEAEIEALQSAQCLPFKPAFVNGRRRRSESSQSDYGPALAWPAGSARHHA